MTTVADGLYQFGGAAVGVGGLPFPATGKWWFVDPVNGSDGNPGTAPNRAVQTLYRAHLLATSGNNDVVVLMANGSSTGSARLSLAGAVAADPTNSGITTGTLLWTKSAVHLVGMAPPSMNSRARIAPPTGTYTEATFNSLTFVKVTGSGCFFSNLAVFQGFSTGATGQLCWVDQGQRNTYFNVAFQGMNDAASAGGSGSRSLVVGNAGNGEHTFVRCIIGDDTTTRSAANASLELTGGTPRNRFTECVFPVMTSSASALAILATAASAIDRFNIFERCLFLNAIKSTSTQMTVAASLGSASPGGMLVFKDCDSVGMTKWGDTNALANSYVSNVGGASTGGLDINPS